MLSISLTLLAMPTIPTMLDGPPQILSRCASKNGMPKKWSKGGCPSGIPQASGWLAGSLQIMGSAVTITLPKRDLRLVNLRPESMLSS
jgi:hypothetical protein